MPQYSAVLMHGDRGGEGTYVFESDIDLMAKTPAKVIRTFMAFLEARHGDRIGQVDYELNGALKSRAEDIVTGMGSFILSDGEQPFVVFITEATTGPH